MEELTIEFRYKRENGVCGIGFKVHRGGKDIELALAYDEQFSELLCDLSKRFTEIVAELNAED